MPRVRFINEVVTVDAPHGATLLEVCERAGISVFRGLWKDVHCGSGLLGKLMPMGTCGRCKVWVKPDSAGGVNPPSGRETVHPKIEGTFRLACQVRVLGDLDLTTRPGGETIAEDTSWNRDPSADSSKWMERWRKAKAGGATAPGDDKEPSEA